MNAIHLCGGANRVLCSASLTVVLFSALSPGGAHAQSPSILYTWNGTGNNQSWTRNFGAANTSATLANSTAGALIMTETSLTAGGSQAFSDGANRVRESSTVSSGGTDLTGLSYLEFRLGHNGAGNINVQFFVQASTAFSYVALGPDLAVAPGLNTYQVPLAGLTAAQAVYIRTFGFNARDHAALGNVTWTLEQLNSGGTPLSTRTVASFDNGTAEGGLQGAIANFDLAGISGNNGGQNQTGLSHNANGSGSLEWIDLGGGPGGAISLGNGTAWNGNTFNNRTLDLSNYGKMIIRLSAEEINPGAGGSVSVQGFLQANNFSFRNAGTESLLIDGLYHDLEFSIAGLANLEVVDQLGLNLGAHPTDLRINVDNIMFVVPEPQSSLLLVGGLLAVAARRWKHSRSVNR